MLKALLVPHSAWSQGSDPQGAVNASSRKGIVIHHPFPHRATPGAGIGVELREVRAMDQFHRSKGWAGIGYHWVIAQSGRIFEGRGSMRSGAHAPNFNSTTFGLAFLVDGTMETPSKAAEEAVDLLLVSLIKESRLRQDYLVMLHREVSNTSCPGDKLALWVEQKTWKRSNTVSTAVQRRVLREGMRGEDVRQLQAALELQQAHRTGYFGPITRQAVEEIQKHHGLTVDGIVGPQTYKVLYEQD